jgi:hypothetical protein
LRTLFRHCGLIATSTSLIAALTVGIGCQSSESGGGAGGATGSVAGSGGTVATTGSAGTTGAAGASPTGTGGATAGSSGVAGSVGDGGSVGAGGRGGNTTGAGGRAGAVGSRGGSGGGATSGGAGSTGAAGAGTGTLAITGLKIDPNPNMTISCFVSWTTATAASSEVDFGEASYQFRIRDSAMVTAHKVLVIGMHAEKAYKIKAVSSNADGTGSAEGTFTTGKLPASVPLPMLTANDPANSQSGWTITNIMPAQSGPANIVMYDQSGIPVWYYIHGTSADSRGDVIAKLLPNNNVLVGPTSGQSPREVDLSGKVVWTGPAQSNAMLMTHLVGKLSNGNYLLNIELDKAVTSGSTKVDNQLLEEIKPDLTVVWSWKLFDHIPPSGNREELCHGNTFYIDEAAGFVYYNCRYLGLFKIDRASGDILWRLGGSYDKTSIGAGDFTYSPESGRFSDDHEPEIHDDGTLLLYDNGGFSGVGATNTNYHSRVLEYQVDQTAKTAKVTWEFPGTFSVDAWYKNSWYSPYWGDADRLANGNILITAAIKSASASTRILEVTRAGKVVWEITMPVNNGSFQADRLSPPPLVETIQ